MSVYHICSAHPCLRVSPDTSGLVSVFTWSRCGKVEAKMSIRPGQGQAIGRVKVKVKGKIKVEIG